MKSLRDYYLDALSQAQAELSLAKEELDLARNKVDLASITVREKRAHISKLKADYQEIPSNRPVSKHDMERFIRYAPPAKFN